MPVLIDREEAVKVLRVAAQLANPKGVIPAVDPEHSHLMRLFEVLDKAAATIAALPPYTTGPASPSSRPICIKCGHGKYYQNSKKYRTYTCHIGMPECGCHCEFTAPAAAQPVPWKDAGGHKWEIRQGVTCVECPHCLFTFAAIHTVKPEDYDCPNCDGCPDATPQAPTTEARERAQKIVTIWNDEREWQGVTREDQDRLIDRIAAALSSTPSVVPHGDMTLEEEVVWRREHEESMLKSMKAQGEWIEKLQSTPSVGDAIAEADKQASVVHDAIYAEPFDKQVASDAVWKLHEILRRDLQPSTPSKKEND